MSLGEGGSAFVPKRRSYRLLNVPDACGRRHGIAGHPRSRRSISVPRCAPAVPANLIARRPNVTLRFLRCFRLSAAHSFRRRGQFCSREVRELSVLGRSVFFTHQGATLKLPVRAGYLAVAMKFEVALDKRGLRRATMTMRFAIWLAKVNTRTY